MTRFDHQLLFQELLAHLSDQLNHLLWSKLLRWKNYTKINVKGDLLMRGEADLYLCTVSRFEILLI